MGAVWYRARSELRRRWAGTLVLALLVGVAGGAVLTAVAGARRTDTALDRFIEYHRPGTLQLTLGEEGLDPGAVARLPQVDGTTTASYVLMSPARPDGSPDPDAAGTINPFLIIPETGPPIRFLVVEGRAPEFERDPLETAVDEQAADRFGVGPGSTLRMWGYSPEQLENAGERGEEPPAGPAMDLRVTAVIRTPQDVVPRETDQDVIYLGSADLLLGRAWYERYGDQVGAYGGPSEGLDVRLRRGRADVPAFEAAVRRLPGGAGAAIDVSSEADTAAETTRNAVDIQVIALYAFAGLALVAGFLIVGQALARAFAVAPAERTTLSALGLTTSSFASVALLRGLVVGVLGAVLAVVIAIAASPLMPIGFARNAEIDPGVDIDLPVLALGAMAIVLLVLARTALAAIGEARRARSMTGVGRSPRPSALVERLAKAGAPTAAISGIGAALEPRGGRSARSLRAAIVGTALAGVATVGAFGFAVSLDRLVSSPQLQGWNWDVAVGNGQDDPTYERSGEALLDAQPAVGSYAAVAQTTQADVGGERVTLIGIGHGSGGPFFAIDEGRPPTGADEVVLGRHTMRTVGAEVGDRIDIVSGGRTVSMRVVGEAAIYDLATADRLGRGAAVTLEGFRRLQPEPFIQVFLVNYADGISDAEGYAALRRDWGRTVLRPVSATDVANLDAIGSLPFVLAGLVGVLAVAALGHALVTSVRRRRRDLAVLRTIGFVGRQLRASVAWQATTLMALALIVGVPLGVAAGRWIWRVVAESLGTAVGPVTPVVAVLLIVPATVLLANAIAAIPARSAARTEPATVLRSE